ncbi:hypothetical protein PGB90_007419 [Kerria lacca]
MYCLDVGKRNKISANMENNITGDSGDGESKEKKYICEKNNDITPPVNSDSILEESDAIDDSSNPAVDFIVVYNKHKYDITFNSNKTVKELKAYLQGLIGVPENLQKVMFKGLAKDEQTLKELDVKSGAKVMVVGSKLDQVLAVKSGPQEVASDEKVITKEPLCKQKMHVKILEKGIPDDIMVGIKNAKDPLPSHPLAGMLNKNGGKVRLTFKLELDQLWIGTKDRTEKISMNSIKTIVSEPIEGHEEYHIMGFQLGSSEASRYWVYWVPAQYVDSIKSAILGTWML